MRCFGQVKLGMELCCTRVTWLTLDEVIEKALKEAFLKLKEHGTFLKEAEGILDMVFRVNYIAKLISSGVFRLSSTSMSICF